MKVGDRVRVIKNGHPKYTQEGIIVEAYGNNIEDAWWVNLDGEVRRTSFYEKQLEVIEEAAPKVDPFAYVLHERVEKNKERLIEEINEFRKAAAVGNLGRFSSNGLLSVLVSVLVSDSE